MKFLAVDKTTARAPACEEQCQKDDLSEITISDIFSGPHFKIPKETGGGL
jgi:hypothetical protein